MLCLKRMDADCSAAIISDLNTGPALIVLLVRVFKKKEKENLKKTTRETVKQPLIRVLE